MQGNGKHMSVSLDTIDLGTIDRFATIHADYENEEHFVYLVPALVDWYSLEQLLLLSGLEMMDEDECPSEPVIYGWMKVWCAERMGVCDA